MIIKMHKSLSKLHNLLLILCKAFKLKKKKQQPTPPPPPPPPPPPALQKKPYEKQS